MTSVRKRVTNAAIGVAIADNPEQLDAFRKPGCAAAIWRRQTPPHIQEWLDQLDHRHLPKGRVILPSSSVPQTIRHLFDMAGTPIGEEREWLEKDIATLAAKFADLMSTEYLKLRLDVVVNNACRKFHIDAITARLICTYRGTGTQYGISTDGREPRRVFTAQTGAPIVLRGTLWPESPASGLLHRSPPIEGTGETRLLLVLDPATDHSNYP